MAGASCSFDPSEGPDSAAPLTLSAPTEGALCPVEDEDWYSFEMAPGDHILRVQLQMLGDLSPVEPTYAVWSVDASGAPDRLVAEPPPDGPGHALDVVHCVAPGRHLVVVHDEGDDAQDLRRAYALEVSSSPDPDGAEPNDDPEGATALGTGPQKGAIACRGDQDWYRIDVAAGEYLRLRLTAPPGDLQTTLTMRDEAGAVLLSETNAGGTVSATALDRFAVVPGAGRYYLVVADDDDEDADPDAPYTLTVDRIADTDPNEPNHHPSVATPLAEEPQACAEDWSPMLERVGTIAAEGDSDWYVLPVSGCERGVLEATATFLTTPLSPAAAWELQQRVQASLTLVRADPSSPCSEDADCRALVRPCDDEWACAGFGNTCLGEGLCAGASVCLPTGTCGATVLERHHTASAIPGDISAPPPPDEARLSAPLAGGQALWLRVSDYQANGAEPTVSYRLRARVRRDPDTHEPSNLFAPTLLSEFPVGAQEKLATAIPVHRCIPPELPEDPAADCCDDGTWVEGALSYENDLDWYRYEHPCPDEDCMLRVRFQIDAGPVDAVMSVYRGKALWYDTVNVTAEAPTQPALDASFGGLGAGASCFYAFQGHDGDPFNYYLMVRDLAEVREWSADQRYRVCVEKVADGCEAPCKLYPDGCGQP
ncbi:MAG: PPC domain-containing protein [Deltaproteobacteria bacterium]|nr:PPC domain-containing protein [Deltaproteobacteria bacterium]MCB9786102.1 PPC domain-containing protein [Deltaproteobacteria bacterium]